jgi:hypothetical protein
LVTSFFSSAVFPIATRCGTARVISETAARPLRRANHIETDVSRA